MGDGGDGEYWRGNDPEVLHLFIEGVAGRGHGFTQSERFKKHCSHSARDIKEAVFLIFASFRLSDRVYHAFAEASQKIKNPRSEMATVFFKPL
jgi:hypothetical protein